MGRMDQLIAMICDEGEGVLLQAPYYSGQWARTIETNETDLILHVLTGFDKDLGARNG